MKTNELNGSANVNGSEKGKGDGRGKRAAAVTSGFKGITVLAFLTEAYKGAESALAFVANVAGKAARPIAGSLSDGYFTVGYKSDPIVSIATLADSDNERSYTAPMSYIVSHREPILTALAPVLTINVTADVSSKVASVDAALAMLESGLESEADEEKDMDESASDSDDIDAD